MKKIIIIISITLFFLPFIIFYANINTKNAIIFMFITQTLLVSILFINFNFQKKAQKKIQNLMQQMKFILSATNTELEIIDSNHNLVYIDPEWKRKNNNMPKNDCCSTIAGTKDKCASCSVLLALETKKCIVSDEIIPEENNRPLQVITIPFQNEKREWFVARVKVDMTEQKNTEEALKESEEHLRITLNSICDAVITTDTSGNITRMNPAAEKMCGIKLSEAYGKSLYKTIKLKVKQCQKSKENISHHLVNAFNKSKDDDIRILIGDNNVQRVVSISSSHIQNSQSQKVGVVFIFHDITDKIRTEEKLKYSSKMDALGLLAGGIAHDFNNMLTGILGYAELLIARLENSELIDQAKIIRSTTINASILTQKLLSFSKKGNTITKLVNTHDYINESINLLKHSIDKRIKIITSLNSKKPLIMGDPSQVENIILNLAINAKDAMPEGGTLTISTDDLYCDAEFCQNNPFDISPGNYIKVSIHDTGIGIKEDMLKHIFEPFFTTKTKVKGTGLGLAAVYGAMKEHNGSITVKSKKEHGTTFDLYFPVKEINMQNITKTRDVVFKGKGTVLVIDDEEIIRNLLETLLTKLGYNVLLAKDGLDGIEIYRDQSSQIDLVLLDMIMPRMNGRDCFYELKNLNKEAKVIIVSGFTDEANIEKLKDDGLLDYLKKPFKKSELSQKVSVALNENHAIKLIV